MISKGLQKEWFDEAYRGGDDKVLSLLAAIDEAETRADAAEADNERLKDRLYVAESYLAEAGVELPDRIQDSRLQKAEKALEAVREQVCNLEDFICEAADRSETVDHYGYAAAKKLRAKRDAILDGKGE